MRAFAWAAASLLVATPAPAAPARVASLNLCTDELLLTIADARQIASVSYLSQKPQESSLSETAKRYRANDGSLLDVAALKPDLILTMGGGARDRLAIGRRLGVRVIDLPYPQRLSDVQRSIAIVGQALGRAGAAQALNARIDALRLSAPRSAVDSIWLGGGGRSVAAMGLAAEWMRLAGLKQRPLDGDRVSLEQLLVSPPSVLLRSNYRSGEYSGEQRWLGHPLARRVRAGKTIATDGRAWTCMGPLMIGEIAWLKRELRR